MMCGFRLLHKKCGAVNMELPSVEWFCYFQFYAVPMQLAITKTIKIMKTTQVVVTVMNQLWCSLKEKNKKKAIPGKMDQEMTVD